MACQHLPGMCRPCDVSRCSHCSNFSMGSSVDTMQESAGELSDPGTPKQSASGSRYGLSPSHHLQPPSPSRLRQETPFTGAAAGSPAPQAGPDTEGLHSSRNHHQVLKSKRVSAVEGGGGGVSDASMIAQAGDTAQLTEKGGTSFSGSQNASFSCAYSPDMLQTCAQHSIQHN